MRIATFNVNSIKARAEFVLGWLTAREPDVVCLQELKVTDDKFPRAEFEALGYHVYLHGQPQWNGVAVLSKQPGEVVKRGLEGVEEAGARLITVAFDELSVTSVYVPNGKSVDHADYQVKLVWMAALLDDVRSSRGERVIGGDFNIAHRDVDTYAPDGLKGTCHHTDAERRAIDGLLDCGLTDLFRHKNPDDGMFSWWDYRGGAFHKNMGLRIDLLLATSGLTDRAERVWVDRDYRKKQQGQIPSDHAPVIAEFSA